MTRIERPRGFDDGWRRVVWQRRPYGNIKVAPLAGCQRHSLPQDLTKVRRVAPDGRSHIVGGRRCPRVIAPPRIGRNQDWENWGVVTALVEVLQIKRIVPRLLVVRPTVLSLAALEFNWEDRRTRGNDCIDATPQAWNIKLEIDVAGNSCQGASEA